MTAALVALRAATAPEHERLERGLDVVGRSRTAEGYRGLLESFWGLYGALEPRLETARSAARVLPGWSRREGLGWLAADLDDLGCGVERRRGLPRCASLPPLNSADEVWGCLYVVEGASLGGGVIAADLARRAGPGGTLPSRFFSGHGAERGRRWHRFRQGLAARLDGPGSAGAVEESARATFLAFERWCAPAPVGAAAGEGGRG